MVPLFTHFRMTPVNKDAPENRLKRGHHQREANYKGSEKEKEVSRCYCCYVVTQGAHAWCHARLGVPPRSASREEKNPCARWKEMSWWSRYFGTLLLRLSFLLRRYKGHKRKFLVRPFSLLGFSGVYCYLVFVYSFRNRTNRTAIVHLVVQV